MELPVDGVFVAIGINPNGRYFCREDKIRPYGPN